MNFFGIHFCQDELYALMMCVPFFGFAVNWVRTRRQVWRARHTTGCTHVDTMNHDTIVKEHGR
jgi:hypothetical protein